MTTLRLFWKKSFRWLVYIGLTLLLFVVLLWLALQMPVVQNRIITEVTDYLSEKVDSRLAIDHIEIDFFSRLVLEGVYVEDLKGDTLLYAGSLKASLSLFAPLQQQIQVNRIQLQETVVNLQRGPDSTFNYQFLLDAFSSDSPTDTTTKTSSPFQLGVDRLQLDAVRFNLLDSIAAIELHTNVRNLDAQLNALNLQDQSVDIQLLSLKNTTTSFASWKTPDTTAVSESDTPLTFPFPGWELRANRLELSNINFSFEDRNSSPATTPTFDPTHMAFQQVDLVLEDFQWTSENLQGTVQNLAFRENNGFELEKMITTFVLTNENITLNNLQFETPYSTLTPTEATLEFTDFSALSNFVDQVLLDIDLGSAEIAVSDLEYWSGPIPALAKWQDQKIQLSTRLRGTVPQLSIAQLNVQIGQDNQLSLQGQIIGLPEVERLALDLDLKHLRTSYDALKALQLNVPEGLRPFGQMQVSTQIKGTIDSLRANRLLLQTDQYTAFNGTIQTYGLPQTDSLRFVLDIRNLRTQGTDLRGFFKDSIPGPLLALGRLQYQGQVAGSLLDLTLNGQLKTAAGQSYQKGQIQFDPDYKNAIYNGQVQLENMALDQILNTSSLGRATLDLQLDGEGFSLDSLHTNVDVNIAELQFKDYNYRDIKMEGRLDARQFEGQLAIQDDNLTFQFNGLANLNDSLPDFQFSALLDTANFEALNLYPTPLHLHAAMDFRIKGNQIDNLNGKATISDFSISNEQHRYTLERFLLSATAPSPDNKQLRIESDILNAQLTGQYEISNLQPLFLKFINDLYPLASLVDSTALMDTILDKRPQRFDLQLELSDPTRLTKVFTDQLEELDTAWFNLELDSKARSIKINSMVPTAKAAGFTIDNLQVTTTGDPQYIGNQLAVNSIQRDSQLIAANLKVQANLHPDSLYLTVAAGSSLERKRDRFALQAISKPLTESYSLQLLNSVTIDDTPWMVPANNKVFFGQGNVNVQNLRLQNQGQALYAQSLAPRDSNRFAPLAIGFENFKLTTLSALAGQDTSLLSGQLNGAITLSKPDSILLYDIGLQVAELVVAEKQLGDFSINAAPEGEQQLGIKLVLQGQRNEFELAGKYGLNDKTLDFQVDIPRFQLAALDVLSGGNIKDSKGRLAAQFQIKGNVDEPIVTGFTRFEKVSTFVNYLKTRFVLPEHTINFRKSSIDIGDMQLKDIEGNPATFSGQIRHNRFKDIDLDLRFNSPSLLVLNTQAQDNDLFYGKVMLGVNAMIQGAPSAPMIDITTKTVKGTDLTTVPLAGAGGIAQEQFIIYENPKIYREDTSAANNLRYQTNTEGLDLSLQLDLTPEAQITAIIDPKTGDQLKVRGDANLLVEIDPNGQLRTTGMVSITEGSYALNFEGLVKRNFTIQPGSNIYLPGDPLGARFDITAVYTARTSVYELISNQLNLDASQEAAARRRQNIKVLMNMKGTLEQPAITFQIEPGDDVSGSIAEAVSSRLEQLQEQESELNKQVFGLLLFNGFISTNAGSSSLSDTGENIALQSVSGLLTQQLNKLADQYIEGVDLSVGLESYKTTSSDNVTEVQLGLSKQLFNDRLSVQVGGNLGVNSPGQNQSSTTNIAGSFLLEYKLTGDGRYRVRVFRRPDTDIFTEGIRTGAGLIYKKSFGTIRADTTQTTPTNNE